MQGQANEQTMTQGHWSIMLLTTLGFIVCQVLVFSVRNDMPWYIWLYEKFGSWSVTILMHMLKNTWPSAFPLGSAWN